MSPELVVHLLWEVAVVVGGGIGGGDPPGLVAGMVVEAAVVSCSDAVVVADTRPFVIVFFLF